MWEPHFQKTCHLHQEVGHPLTLLIWGFADSGRGSPTKTPLPADKGGPLGFPLTQLFAQPPRWPEVFPFGRRSGQSLKFSLSDLMDLPQVKECPKLRTHSSKFQAQGHTCRHDQLGAFEDPDRRFGGQEAQATWERTREGSSATGSGPESKFAMSPLHSTHCALNLCMGPECEP